MGVRVTAAEREMRFRMKVDAYAIFRTAVEEG